MVNHPPSSPKTLTDSDIRKRGIRRRSLLGLLGPLGLGALGGCIARGPVTGNVGTANTVYTGCTDNDSSYYEPVSGTYYEADAGGYGRYACVVMPQANPGYQGCTDSDFGFGADPVGLGRSCRGGTGTGIPHHD